MEKTANHIRLTVMILLMVGPVLAQQSLAPRPPMGWNSWDAYGTTVTEAEVKANADYMAKKLAKFGWSYVVVDIQWYGAER
jgi:alpha-galactosidase